MAYADRLRKLRYTSPSGQEFTLFFDDVSRSGGKKAPVSEFPGQDQGAVQDLGETTPAFNISCYIAGMDYDREADRLWDALAEDGPGILDHPRWGRVSVLPSSRDQSESFVDRAGRAVFNIEFVRAEVRSFEYPNISAAVDDQIAADVGAAVTEIEDSFAGVEITETRSITGISGKITGAITTVSNTFNQMTGVNDQIRSDLNSLTNEITNNVDTLVQAPQQLMESMLQLYRTPAAVAIDVKEKIQAYEKIFTGLADGFVEATELYGEAFGLIATANMAGIALAAAESTTGGNIPNRTQAGDIVDLLSALDAKISDTIEEIEAAGDFSAGYVIPGMVSAAVSKALGNLIDRSLALPTERKVILDGYKTPIELVWEFYGDVSNDLLDEFIEYNDLQGNDILLIPMGAEVRYNA